MANDSKLWNKLLSESPKGSALMGGAIIDNVFGVKPKDYDIFYSYKPGLLENIPPNWKMTDADFNDPVWVAEHDAWYVQGVDENGGSPISSVIEYLVDGEHLVQLIGVNYKNPLEHFKNFDHSLTLGWYCKKGIFIHRKVFDSVNNEIIEYVGKDKSNIAIERSRCRAINKSKKYHNIAWTLKGFEID